MESNGETILYKVIEYAIDKTAVKDGCITIIDALIAAGVDVNAGNKYTCFVIVRNGMTPLHRTSLDGKATLVSALIARNANMNAMNT